MIGNALRFALGIFSGIIILRLERPRLRSNESPSGAFKRQSGLRKQMEGRCPDKLCGALQTLFSQGAEKANDNALRSAALPKEAALQVQFTIATLLVKKAERNARRRSVLPKSKINFP